MRVFTTVRSFKERIAAIFPTCPRGRGMQALNVINMDCFDLADVWRNCDDIVCHGGEWLPATQVPASQVRYDIGAKVWVDFEAGTANRPS